MGDAAVSDPPGLSPLESLMWRLGHDPMLSSAFGSVTLLDRAPDVDALRDRLAAAAGALPRLRRRIVDHGPVLGTRWEDDPDFDLDRHLRVVDDPTVRTARAVLDHAARLVAEPFDPRHPGWTFEVVVGLERDRAVLLQRMHHTIADGQGGIRLSARFLDVERDAVGPLVAARGAHPAPTAPPDGALTVAADRLGSLARGAVGMARDTVALAWPPGRLLGAGADALDLARSLSRQVAVMDRARSPLWTARSTGRRVEVLTVDLPPLRDVARFAGVTVNDVFVTAVVRAAAAHHRGLGTPVDELRLAMPVSTRSRRGPGGNAFSPTRVLVPTGADLTPLAHLAEVSTRLTTTKQERATGAIEPLAALADLVPLPVLTRLMRRQAATIDLTVSNVRAAPFPLYVAGARVDATYALGPLAATAANVTMMSYDDRVDIGVHVDTAAVAEPERWRDDLVAAFASLGVPALAADR